MIVTQGLETKLFTNWSLFYTRYFKNLIVSGANIYNQLFGIYLLQYNTKSNLLIEIKTDEDLEHNTNLLLTKSLNS